MFGWVDFSDDERKRASEVMNLARYPGAIDELGIGVFRDAFSDRLFPATSTLHTHARYYYLVAYLMKDIERQGAGKSVKELQKMCRDGEIETCRRLVAWKKAYETSHDEEIVGITGSDIVETGWVKMTPASMDWAAIQRFGILSDPNLKMKGFFNIISSTPARESDFEEGVGQSAIHSRASLWEVPDSYYSWRKSDGGESALSVWLTPDEARDLKRRIQSRFGGSAYAALLESGSKSIGNDFIDLIDSRAILPDCESELGRRCETAADFSAFVCMLHIRFNWILEDIAHHPEKSADERWEEHYGNTDSKYHERAMECDIDEVVRSCGVDLGIERNRKTLEFLRAAHAAYSTGDTDALDQRIVEREKNLKGEARSKLLHAKDYAGNWYGGMALTYRLEVARMVVSEIEKALEGSDD